MAAAVAPCGGKGDRTAGSAGRRGKGVKRKEEKEMEQGELVVQLGVVEKHEH